MTAPIVLEPGGGEEAAFGAITFTLKAESSSTDGNYSLVEAFGPAFATPHVHHDREEAFYVLEGKVTFLAGERTVESTAGSFLLIPRETMHALRAEGDARILILHSPGGFERFFREASAAIARGEFDQSARDELAARVGVTFHDDVKF